MNALRRNWIFLQAALTRRVPVYVQFAVTKRCNLACRMCQTTAARRTERELDLPEIARLAGVLDRIGIGILILTGGEPLLRDDLPEIIRIFAERGMPPRLQTNAFLADPEQAAALVAAGVKEVTVSLHSLDPEVNDRITGVPGSWHGILKGLAAFSQALPAEGGLCGVNITVSRLNLAEVPSLVRFASFIGFYASLIPVHLKDEGRPGFIVRADAPECGFQSGDRGRIGEVYAELAAMKKSGSAIYNSYRFLRESAEYLASGRIDWRCRSPDLYFSISPQGHFLPCVDVPGGESMLEGNFPERYRSREFKEEIRRRARACPGCMYACYPEITYICEDPKTFLERVAFAFQTKARRRAPRTYEEMLAAAEEMRSGPAAPGGKGFRPWK